MESRHEISYKISCEIQKYIDYKNVNVEVKILTHNMQTESGRSSKFENQIFFMRKMCNIPIRAIR